MNNTIYFTVLFNPEYSDKNIRNKHLITVNGLFLVNDKKQYASVYDFINKKYSKFIIYYITQSPDEHTGFVMTPSTELYNEYKLTKDVNYEEFLNSLL